MNSYTKRSKSPLEVLMPLALGLLLVLILMTLLGPTIVHTFHSLNDALVVTR